MRIITHQHNHDVTLALEGRLDTVTAGQAAADIEQQLTTCTDIQSLTCHLGKLDYISSSGLRLLLSLAKRYPAFRIIEAQPDVFNVLEMTGFVKIMPVERALRQLDIKGCDIVGRGSIGTTYRIDDDTIVKLFPYGTSLDEVQREISMSKEAFVLGMPTAISYDIVRVGTQIGLVYEKIQAETLSACICREPKRLDEFARMYATLFRQLHSINVPATSTIPSAIALDESAIRRISIYFDTPSTDLLLRLLSAIPPARRLLHGDLQPKNTMVQSDQLMLIELGEVSHGHPVLDLAHAASAMLSLIGDYEAVIGLPEALTHDLFMRMLNYYFEGLSNHDIAHRLEQITAVSRIRDFTWLALSNTSSSTIIAQCQEAFTERIVRHREQLISICDTLADWPE